MRTVNVSIAGAWEQRGKEAYERTLSAVLVLWVSVVGFAGGG